MTSVGGAWWDSWWMILFLWSWAHHGEWTWNSWAALSSIRLAYIYDYIYVIIIGLAVGIPHKAMTMGRLCCNSQAMQTRCLRISFLRRCGVGSPWLISCLRLTVSWFVSGLWLPTSNWSQHHLVPTYRRRYRRELLVQDIGHPSANPSSRFHTHGHYHSKNNKLFFGEK